MLSVNGMCHRCLGRDSEVLPKDRSAIIGKPKHEDALQASLDLAIKEICGARLPGSILGLYNMLQQDG